MDCVAGAVSAMQLPPGLITKDMKKRLLDEAEDFFDLQEIKSVEAYQEISKELSDQIKTGAKNAEAFLKRYMLDKMDQQLKADRIVNDLTLKSDGDPKKLQRLMKNLWLGSGGSVVI